MGTERECEVTWHTSPSQKKKKKKNVSMQPEHIQPWHLQVYNGSPHTLKATQSHSNKWARLAIVSVMDRCPNWGNEVCCDSTAACLTKTKTQWNYTCESKRWKKYGARTNMTGRHTQEARGRNYLWQCYVDYFHITDCAPVLLTVSFFNNIWKEI